MIILIATKQLHYKSLNITISVLLIYYCYYTYQNLEHTSKPRSHGLPCGDTLCLCKCQCSNPAYGTSCGSIVGIFVHSYCRGVQKFKFKHLDIYLQVSFFWPSSTGACREYERMWCEVTRKAGGAITSTVIPVMFGRYVSFAIFILDKYMIVCELMCK